MKLLALLVLATTLTSCSSVSPINGSLYTETTAGLSGNGPMGSKKGEACMVAVLGVARGDVSIEAAAKDGKIKDISHVDSKSFNILGIYTQYCTIVYGK
jgi:hypothetical protein